MRLWPSSFRISTIASACLHVSMVNTSYVFIRIFIILIVMLRSYVLKIALLRSWVSTFLATKLWSAMLTSLYGLERLSVTSYNGLLVFSLSPSNTDFWFLAFVADFDVHFCSDSFICLSVVSTRRLRHHRRVRCRLHGCVRHYKVTFFIFWQIFLNSRRRRPPTSSTSASRLQP